MRYNQIPKDPSTQAESDACRDWVIENGEIERADVSWLFPDQLPIPERWANQVFDAMQIGSSLQNQPSPSSTRSAASRRSNRQSASPINTRQSISPITTRVAATASSPIRSPPGSDSFEASPSASPAGERPIKPLPKKRIRDRLSVEQAENIVFPSVPEHQPLFSFPYTSKEGEATFSTRRPQPPQDENRHPGPREEWGNPERIMEIEAYARKGDQMNYWRDQEKPMKKATGQMNRSQTRHPSHGKGKPSQSSLGESVNSSVDGDEGFENTNNKKKRKIPQSNGSLTINHVALSADLANTHLSSPQQEPDATAGAEDAVAGERAGAYYETPTGDRSGIYYGSGTAVSTSPSLQSTHRMPAPLPQQPRIRRPGSGRGSLDRRQVSNTYSKEGTSFGHVPTRRTTNSSSKASKWFPPFLFSFYSILYLATYQKSCQVLSRNGRPNIQPGSRVACACAGLGLGLPFPLHFRRLLWLAIPNSSTSSSCKSLTRTLFVCTRYNLTVSMPF
jgi:hypothetical protein